MSHSRREADFRVGFALLVRADPDRDFLVEPLEEIEQLVRGEAAEMAIHQMRHVRLRDAEQFGDFPLLE